MFSAPPVADEFIDATDAQFGLRTLLKVTGAMAVLAAALGPFVRQLDPDQQVRLLTVWGLWLAAVVSVIGYQAHQRRAAERLAGRALVRLPMFHENLPDLTTDSRNLHRLGTFALGLLFLVVATALAVLRAPARDPATFLRSWALVAAYGLFSAFVICRGVRMLWWRKSIRFGATGILWDRRCVPWEGVTHYGWQDQIVLAVRGTDHHGADTELHVRVPWKLRGTVEGLLASKVPTPPLGAGRSVQEGVAGPQQPWGDAVRPQTRSRDSFIALITALVIYALMGMGLPDTPGLDGMMVAALVVSLGIWFWNGSVTAVRPGVLLVRLVGRAGWGVWLWVAVAAGWYALKSFYPFMSDSIALASGFIYGMALAHVSAGLLLQHVDLRERAVVVPGRLCWRWTEVRVIRWDRHRSGRLVLGRGWRQIVATVPVEQREVLDGLLRQKFGPVAGTVGIGLAK